MNKAELIQKFIENNCSAEEARLVMRFIEEEPSLIDNYLKKEDWDSVDDLVQLHPNVDKELRKNVFEKTIRRPVLLVIRSLAVAASVAAIVLLASLFFTKTRPVLEEPFLSIKKTEPTIRQILNKGSAIKEILLADKSSVILYPGSQIEFNKNFTTNRNIKLIGRAVFNVAKDKAHPFTVYTGNIATTAIGTKFLIDNSSTKNRLNIQLFDGKVLVKSTDAASKIKSSYLLPGQQCFIDLYKNNLVVASISKAPIAKTKHARPFIEETEEIEIVNLNFDNKPLSEVLTAIEKVYARKIEFKPEDISGAFFTGSFRSEDSLASVMKVITTMNGLTSVYDGNVTKIISLNGYKPRKQAVENNNGSYENHLMAQHQEHRASLILIDSPLLTQQPKMISVHPEGIAVAGGAIHCHNAGLKKVIEKIIDEGGYEISFNESELQGKYFTGKINLDRNIMIVLRAICNMHGLNLDKKDEKYNINIK